jgi:hypothetical protein
VSSGPIYPYIPFASALVWNRRPPADGAEPKIHVSFSPDWFTRRMSLDYGRRWHTDPLYRRESFVGMARALNAEFPGLRLGGVPEEILGGLSQIDSCALMAALFGQDIVYSSEAWPENGRKLLDDASAEALEAPDVQAHPVYEDLMRQMELIEREWGKVEGELNYQGVLNTAFRLRGEQIFVDMSVAPRRAHRVLAAVCETMIRLADAVYARQAASGVGRDYFVTSNCVVNMISEAHYRQFIQPYDRKLSEHYPHFGIHNCGWKVDTYAAAYAEINPLGYLDFGIQSDLPLIKHLFPEATLTVILNPDDVLGRGPGEIESTLRHLRETLGRCRIIVGSLDGRTASSEIVSFFDTAAAVWRTSPEQLVPQPHFG